MRFPPYLFGYPMTIGLWYLLVFLGALLVMWIITKIFSNVVKDFASGFIIFLLIVIFGFIFINLITGSEGLTSSADNFFNNLFR